MTKEHLIQLIESGLSSHGIAKKINRCQTTVSYWLRKHNLKTKASNKKRGEKSSVFTINGCEYKSCPRCEKNKEINEFSIRKRGGHYSYCKVCLSEQKKERHNSLKKLCLDYKGGKCSNCGYNKCNSALEFHHLDSDEKEFQISEFSKTDFEKIKSELDKCELLCSNCHRELHAGLI